MGAVRRTLGEVSFIEVMNAEVVELRLCAGAVVEEGVCEGRSGSQGCSISGISISSPRKVYTTPHYNTTLYAARNSAAPFTNPKL